MTLNGNSDEANGYNSVIKNGETANANFVKSVVPPIGSILSWCKTFDSADSGTTDSATASKLNDSTQNFETTISVGMVIHNTTDDTFAYVTAVDSDTVLSISSDIMANAEAYTIYTTPNLPDGWVECDGSALSDSDSPFDGATLPDLNATPSFMRGGISSGSTGGADTHNHKWLNGWEGYASDGTSSGQIIGNEGGSGSLDNMVDGMGNTQYTSKDSGLPVYYQVVFIMRVK